MPNIKPFVSAACICEKVLHEKDNVLSAIRIVDTFYVQRPVELSDQTPSGVQINALLMLKSGDLTGPSEITIKMRSPTGRIVEVGEKYPIMLNGGEHGANIHMVFGLELKDEFGLFWFDVYWNGEALTSIPFKLVEGPMPAAATSPEKSSQ